MSCSDIMLKQLHLQRKRGAAWAQILSSHCVYHSLQEVHCNPQCSPSSTNPTKPRKTWRVDCDSTFDVSSKLCILCRLHSTGSALAQTKACVWTHWEGIPAEQLGVGSNVHFVNFDGAWGWGDQVFDLSMAKRKHVPNRVGHARCPSGSTGPHIVQRTCEKSPT